MIIQNFLFIGLVLSGLEITVSEDQRECPNQPVTPYPIPKTSTSCPNLPIRANPTCCHHLQIINCEMTCCLHQQTSPSWCQQRQTSTNSCCTIIQSNPNQNSQCCSQSCCDVAAPNCCSSTVSNCLPTTLCCCQKKIDSIIKCPPGTQLIGKECALIYCPRGTQMVNERCVKIECPEGSIWIGHRCSVPESTVQNITLYNTIITNFNQTKPEILIKNTNNIVVNASVTIKDDTDHNKDCDDECGNKFSKTEVAPQSKCCLVMTPRICKLHDSRWRCYSRRSRRCGAFCIAPIIYLKPSRVYSSPQYVVMPPIQNDCESYGNCGPVGGGYDCSGCAINDMMRCSSYCYRYSCPTRRCEFYDQELYCSLNAYSYGCQEEDGCLDGFCQ